MWVWGDHATPVENDSFYHVDIVTEVAVVVVLSGAITSRNSSSLTKICYKYFMNEQRAGEGEARQVSLDAMVQRMLEQEPDSLRVLLRAMGPDDLLVLSATLLDLSHRDPAYFDERPGRARDLLEIVIEIYRENHE